MEEFMPIPSFYFQIEVEDEIVASFQEVSGLEVSLEVEEVIEGGNNLYKYRLPTRQAYSNITLSKAIVNEDGPFYEWVKDVLLKQESLDNSFVGKVKTILIHLLSPQDKEEVRSWQIVDAYPIKCSVSSLNAAENKICIETVDLAFRYLEDIK